MPQSITDRPRLSVAILVRDAAEVLAETLRSAAAIADEIVVVDTGSTDRTLEVAREASAEIIEVPWTDDFAAARNEGLSHVGGDWVLWLDAGEQIAEEDGRDLKGFVIGKADPAQAYMLLVKVPPAGATVAGEQIGRIRLVPNHPGIRFRGRVRESMAESLREAGITVEGLPWRIHRGRREHDPQVKVRKARRNLHLAQMETGNGEPSPGMLCCTGEALQTLGERRQAADCFRRAIQASERGSAEMLEAYYGLLTSLDGTAEAGAGQLAACLESVEVFPLDAQLLCALGGYLQGEGRLELAARAYETAFKYGQVHPETWHMEEIAEIAAFCQSLCLQLQQKDDRARRVLEEAVASYPSSRRLRRGLIELHVKHGRRDEAIQEVDRLPAGTADIETLRSAVRGACLAAEKNWIPAMAYLKTAYSAGCRDPLCLRWLAIAMLAAGDLQRAGPILEEWKDIEPENGEVQKYLDAIAAADRRRAPAEPSGDAEAGPKVAAGKPHIRIDEPASAGRAESPHAKKTTAPQSGDASEPPAPI